MELVDLGQIHYSAALSKQKKLSAEFSRSKIVVFEPERVITLGRRTEFLQDFGIEQLKLDRGGEATYHGPGQILIFPVLHLPTAEVRVRDWVCALLKISEIVMRGFGVDVQSQMARPGLYTPNGKIASVGIRIERGWNLHGLAINFAGDLTSFGLIDPCGVKGAQMDKVSNWACPSRSEFINRWLSAYEEWFSRTVNRKIGYFEYER